MTDAKQKMIRARSRMLLNYPMYGSLASYLKLKKVPDGELEAAGAAMATDGENLIFSDKITNERTLEEIKFAIAHEVMHLGLGHLWRKGTRNKEKWNIAADYAINNILDEENFGTTLGLVNHDYDNMSAEQIYEELPDPPRRGLNPPECPKCGSDNVTRKKLTIDKNGKGKAEYKCEECGHEWEEEVLVSDRGGKGRGTPVPWEEVEDNRPDTHETWDNGTGEGGDEENEKKKT